MKKIKLVLFIIFISLFVSGCKNENNTFENKGLDVKSTDGYLRPGSYVVHYKTDKRVLNVGEDLPVMVSFGTTRNYHKYTNLKSVSAELYMRTPTINAQNFYTDYIEFLKLKTINDFTLDEYKLDDYKGTFTSEENVLNVTIPAHWFDSRSRAIVFTLMVEEEYSLESGDKINKPNGSAALYFRRDGDKIKLYGNIDNYNNDII